MGQQTIHELDRRAALLAAFDSMSDESQIDAVHMLQSIAKDSPRRVAPSLRLVASKSDGFDFRKSAS